jgi:hypothetical protein
MKYLSTLVAVALLCGCALPTTKVTTGAAPPTLIVTGAPAGSILMVDGLAMGNAAQYDGHPETLAVLEGSHQVEVRLGGNVVYRERAFVSGGESHTVTVTEGHAP